MIVSPLEYPCPSCMASCRNEEELRPDFWSVQFIGGQVSATLTITEKKTITRRLSRSCEDHSADSAD